MEVSNTKYRKLDLTREDWNLLRQKQKKGLDKCICCPHMFLEFLMSLEAEMHFKASKLHACNCDGVIASQFNWMRRAASISSLSSWSTRDSIQRSEWRKAALRPELMGAWNGRTSMLSSDFPNATVITSFCGLHTEPISPKCQFGLEWNCWTWQWCIGFK